MTNQKTNDLPNFWFRILIPIGFAILTGLICLYVPQLKPYLGIGITIPFNITTSILGILENVMTSSIS